MPQKTALHEVKATAERVTQLAEAVQETLGRSLDEQQDTRLREVALTLAVGHYKKINFTGDPTRIVALATAFHAFLKP